MDVIIFGEGELTFTELDEKALEFSSEVDSVSFEKFKSQIKGIRGIYYREGDIQYTGDRDCIENLDEIPFPYPEIVAGSADPDHKIYYYESSRGCPFCCSYCLSSVDKRVRFKSFERTCEELQIFLDHKVKLVKFVDRTFNLMNHHNTELAIQIHQPDVLVRMPFDAYGAISDYAKASEIAEIGRQLMSDALTKYESANVDSLSI